MFVCGCSRVCVLLVGSCDLLVLVGVLIGFLFLLGLDCVVLFTGCLVVLMACGLGLLCCLIVLLVVILCVFIGVV